MKHRTHRQRGFTLIELMVTIAIAGVMASIAIGYSGNFFRKNRLNQLARGVYTAVSSARAEAVRHSKHSVVAFESTRVVAFIDSMTGGTRWKYDDGIDTKVYIFNFADASLKPSTDLDMDTTGLTTGVAGVGTIPPSLIFTSSGYNVKRTTSNDLEQLAELSVTFKHKGIPTGQNIFRKIEVTVAGAIRVSNK